MLKLGFLRSGTLYPIFVFFRDRCFFYATFLKICFTEAPICFLNFCKKPNVLRELKTPQSFRHYATYRRPLKIFENFFPQFSVFKGFSLRKMGFCCFQLGKNGFRDLCVSFRVFFGSVYCKIDEILMSFYPWFL